MSHLALLTLIDHVQGYLRLSLPILGGKTQGELWAVLPVIIT